MPLLDGLLADLSEESGQLEECVAPLPDPAWHTPTPAAGWSIAHQIAHLAWTDDLALRAATDPDGFRAATGSADVGTSVDAAAAAGAAQASPALLAQWRAGRVALAAALAGLPPGTALPWFGPPMSAASMATARLMETWAHGVDVRDALGLLTPMTDRLRHVAHLGVRTRGFAFLAHGLVAPEQDVRVELTGPAGQVWTWGPEDAEERVTGPALDFCLRVTRRRHRDDLALVADGPGADRWLDLAQAFAGPPGEGRAPAAGVARARG